MPVNRAFTGCSARAGTPIEVTRGDIRRFALAIGDENPLYWDVDAARAKGYRDVLAPPTFLITVAASIGPGLLTDPALGLEYSLVVHGQQGFALHRPVCAGDVLDGETRIDDVRAAGRNELITLITEFTSNDSPVATLTNTIVSRGTAEDAT